MASKRKADSPLPDSDSLRKKIAYDVDDSPPQDSAQDSDSFSDSFDDDGDETDFNDEEQDEEVEEFSHTVLDDPDCLVKFRLSVSEDEEFSNWLSNIRVSCTYEGKHIGSALGRYVHREMIASEFWGNMEEPSKGMSDIAVEVFDRYGDLKNELKEHTVRRGTGVWGAELDNGPLLLIEIIEIVDKEWRRKGVGRAMVKALIDKAERQQKHPNIEDTTMFELLNGKDWAKCFRLHTIVLPGWLRTDVYDWSKKRSPREQRAINFQAFDAAVAFYRALGFRRIGASSCFAFSSDSKHKSHAISITDDFDPTEPPEDISDDEEYDENQMTAMLSEQAEKLADQKNERLKQTHPLHHGVTTLSDADCVEFYKTLDKAGTEWEQADRQSENCLHLAACRFMSRTIRWLIDNVNTGEKLTSARNLKGYTPVEALWDLLDKNRSLRQVMGLTITMSDKFEGFPIEAIDCLALLKHGSNAESLPEMDRLRLKYGCTCGECIEGFMSPHMKAALLFQAEVTHDRLNMEINDGYTWCEYHDDVLNYVSPNLQRNMCTNESLRKGFSNIFALVAACLNANTIPKAANLIDAWEHSSEWPPVTKNYLEWGSSMQGKFEAVIRTVIDGAKDKDEKTGHGEFERTMCDEVAQLKKCRNDHEYGFVALALGLLPEPRGFSVAW